MKYKQPMLINPSQFGLFVLEISRKEVEDFDHVDVLHALQNFRQEGNLYAGKLAFFFPGYEEDPRELYEIPEVTYYAGFLNRCFPYWFYFLSRNFPPAQSPYLTLLQLIVPITTSIDATNHKRWVQFDPEILTEMVNTHWHFFNELTVELRLDQDVNYKISMEINTYLSSIFNLENAK